MSRYWWFHALNGSAAAVGILFLILYVGHHRLAAGVAALAVLALTAVMCVLMASNQDLRRSLWRRPR